MQNADGSWSYALDNTRAATQALTAASNTPYTLNYTMTDADGDQSSAKLTITVQGADDTQKVTVQAAGGATTTVYETALVDGSNELSDPALNSDPREVVSGTFAVSATDGIASVTVKGTAFTLAQLQTPAYLAAHPINTVEGTLVITSYSSGDGDHTATIGYSYTLADNVLAPPAATTFFDDIGNPITVTGVGGVASAPSDLVIRIIDDVPTATDDTNFVPSVAAATATGNVITGFSSAGLGGADTPGADGAVVSAIHSDGLNTNGTIGSSLAGEFGTLKILADGSYTYTRTASAFDGGDDVFTYTLKDGDGDTVTAKLTVTSAAQGITGGHFDVDTYNFTGSTKTLGHVHQYDDKTGLRDIDTFGLNRNGVSGLNDIDDATTGIQTLTPATVDGEVFRLIVTNGTRNAGANIEINGKYYDAYSYGDGQTSTYQGNIGNGEAMQLYTLDPAVAAANSNVQLLTSLDISFPVDVIGRGGLRGSVTGDVQSNLKSPDGEWRTGALGIWAVEVLHDNTVPNVAGIFEVSAANDGYKLVTGTINKGEANELSGVIMGITNEAGGSFAAGDGIVFETSTFWHWGVSGTTYGNVSDFTQAQWESNANGELPAGSPRPDPLAADFLSGFKDIFVIGGPGNDTKTYQDNSPVNTIIQGETNPLPAGTDSDTLVVNQGAAINLSQSDDQDTGSSKVVVTGFENVDASGSSASVNLTGSIGANTLIGGSAKDTITGGAGADTLTGNAGADTFVINIADSPGTTGGAGNAGTLTGYDVITDFNPASDVLDLAGTPFAVANTAGVNGTNSTLTIGGNPVTAHSITNGMITFDANATNTFVAAETLTSVAEVAAVVQYLQNNDLGNAGATVAFVATISGTAHTYVYEQVAGTKNSANDILVDLQGVTLTNLSSLITSSHVAPVVLDMNGNGLDFVGLRDSHVAFDWHGDGTPENTAWIGGQDAFLAYDHNGDHVVNDGSEIVFTQYHSDAKTDLDGLRLAFDTNHDGKLDAADADFEKFGVWQDADGDGKTDAGEYHSLSEAGIVSISLLSDGIAYTAAGGEAVVHGTTTFMKADGSVGIAGDVSLAVAPLDVADLVSGKEAGVDAMLPQAGHDAAVHAGAIASADASPTTADVPAVAPTVEHEPVAESAPESGAVAVAIAHPIEPAPVSLSEWIAPIEHAPAAVV